VTGCLYHNRSTREGLSFLYTACLKGHTEDTGLTTDEYNRHGAEGEYGRQIMMHEEVLAELSQLIQDYFVWAVTNPEEAAMLSAVPSLSQQQTGKNKQHQVEHSDLLGFSRWLARGRR
jgi:hypothetical protein